MVLKANLHALSRTLHSRSVSVPTRPSPMKEGELGAGNSRESGRLAPPAELGAAVEGNGYGPEREEVGCESRERTGALK